MKLLGMGTNPTNITTIPSALAVNTYPTYAKSFELQGRSLVLNQLIQNGDFATADEWSAYYATLSITNNVASVTSNSTNDGTLYKAQQYTNGHKYLLFFDASGSVASLQLQVGSFILNSTDSRYQLFGTITLTQTMAQHSIIFTASTTGGSQGLGFRMFTASGNMMNIQNVRLTDLTQMYGAGFEPTTVDQAKVVLGDKYIPFNPGTFIHNNSTYEVNKWNQIIRPIDSTYWDFQNATGSISDGIATFTATEQAGRVKPVNAYRATFTNGHKYFMCGQVKTATATTSVALNSGLNEQYTIATTNWQFLALTVSWTATSGVWPYPSIADRRTSGWDVIQSKDINLVDLTDIFGAGKEPSTVDECKLRFLSMGIDITKYQPYSPLGGQYCGYRNIWDEEWEVGNIDSNGQPVASDTVIRSKNYIKVLPSTEYCIYSSINGILYYYKFDNSFISSQSFAASGAVFATPTDCYYIKFRLSSDYGTTYKNDISIYQVSNKVDLGFNIWDEEWKAGHIVAGIETDDGTYRLISKNYIPVLPNTTYFLHCGISCGATIYTYDANKNYLQYISDSYNTNVLFTTLSNSAYIRLQMYGDYGVTSTLTYGHDICINLSQPDTTKSPHNGDYRPYLMLRGIGQEWNIWDEVWESGTINSSGNNEANGTRIRSKNYIPILPSTTYYVKCSQDTKVYYYDENKSFISTFNSSQNYSFTSIPTARYIRIVVFNTTSYGNNVCINLSQPQTTINPHNGQYVPHLFDTYDSMSGILTRRIGVVDLGAQTWSGGTNGKWRTTITPANKWVANNTKIHAFAEKYEIATANDIYYSVVTVPSIGGEDSDGHLYCYTGSSSTQPSGMFLYELVAYQVFTPIPYSVVDLGSLSWVYDSTYSNFYTTDLNTTIKRPAASNVIPNVKCSKYSAATQDNYSTNNTIKVITNGQVWIKDTSYGTDATAFKTAMNGVMLTYQNNTPYKFGVVDMGSLSWTRVDVTGSGGYVFSTPATPLQMYKQSDNLWCSGYTTEHYTGTGSAIYNYGNKTIAQHTPSGEFNIYVRDDSYTSASDFKNAVKGMILTYELSDSISQTVITQPISFVSGKLGKQYGVVDLGSLSWTYQSTYNYFYLSFSSAKTPTVNLVCAKYKTVDGTVLTNITTNDKVVAIRSGNLVIKDSLYTNTTAFKNSLHGQYLIYELADSATNPTYATAGNLIRKTNGDVGDVDFNLKYWEESQVKLIKVGNKFLAVSE